MRAFWPEKASSISSEVDTVFWVLTGFSVVIVTLLVFFLLYFSLKYRRGSKAPRKPPSGASTLSVELGVILFFILLMTGQFIWAAKVFYRMVTPPSEALEIYVVGKQWMWKFYHPWGYGEINEVHVPLGKKVKFIMSSMDVIHSLFVPDFRIKQDVIPGRYTLLWFEATQKGVFRLYCAEFCGTQHSLMTGKVFVLGAAEYGEWQNRVRGKTAISTSQAQGEKLFNDLGCVSCHGTDQKVAPQLAGLFGKTVVLEGGGQVEADENYLRESILFPRKKIVRGYGDVMPSFQNQVSEEDLLHLISYIKSLPRGEKTP